MRSIERTRIAHRKYVAKWVKGAEGSEGGVIKTSKDCNADL